MVILLQVLEMQMKKLFKNTLKNKEMNNYADSWQPLKMVAFSRLYNIKKPANASFNNLCKYRNDLYIEIQPVLLNYLLPVSRPNLFVVARMIRKHDRYRIPDLIPYLVRPNLSRKLIAVLPENLLCLPHSRAFAD